MSLYNYESEVIYKQVRGETIPQTPVYYAEAKKDILDDVSPNYPQLCEYEKEWLHFSQHVYHEGVPVNLEYATIDNVSRGTFLNSIPFEYKTAILRGQTSLVNFAQNVYHTDGISNVNLTEGRLTWSTQWEWLKLYFVVNGKPNSKYMIKYQSKDENVAIFCRPETSDPQSGWVENVSTSNTIVYTYDVGTFVISLENTTTTSDLWVQDLMIIEYQEGMENWDIPYFEDMQSVKAPILKTTNEDGTQTHILTINDVTLRSNGDVYDELNLLTGCLTQRIDENNEVLAQEVIKTVELSCRPKPMDGTTHLESNALMYFKCPVVSTGVQTLHDITSQED